MPSIRRYLRVEPKLELFSWEGIPNVDRVALEKKPVSTLGTLSLIRVRGLGSCGRSAAQQDKCVNWPGR